MIHQELRDRTKKYAIATIKLFSTLNKTEDCQIIGKQLIRSATSVAANYRAACRGRSDAEFYSKLCIVVEEADETQLWLEILQEAELVNSQNLIPLIKEASEITAIMTASKRTMRSRIERSKK